jgi:hypothetical protein
MRIADYTENAEGGLRGSWITRRMRFFLVKAGSDLVDGALNAFQVNIFDAKKFYKNEKIDSGIDGVLCFELRSDGRRAGGGGSSVGVVFG